MKILATILARGGSKGIPDKNIRPLADRPLIGYTIDQALRWGKFEKLIVSTDSEKIAGISAAFGAEVPFTRPAELASDAAGKLDALRHALAESERHYGMKFDAVLDLDATAPVRTVEDIDNIMRLFVEKEADCVFSVVKARKNPYFNMVEERPDGTVGVCKTPPGEVMSRQSAPKVFELNASIYMYKRDFLMDPANKTPYAGEAYAYEMDEPDSIDIDSQRDFEFLEYLIKKGKVRL